MFKNMRIGLRLASGFGVVFLTMLIIVIVGLSQFADVHEITERIISVDWQKAALANELIVLAKDNARASMELFLLTDKAQISRVLERIESNKNAVSANLSKIEEITYKAEGKALLAKVKEKQGPYAASFTRASQLLLQGNNREEATRVLMNETMPNLDAYIGAIDEFVNFQGKILEESMAEATQHYDSARNLMIGLGGLALIVGAAFAFWLTRSITRPLGSAVAIASRIAKGDLTASIEVTSKDETGQLLAAMEDMVGSLNEMAAAADKVAGGDLTVALQARSDKDVLGKSFLQLRQTIKQLLDETGQLTQWAKDGLLNKRGTPSKFQGAFRELIEGINEMLDVIVAPINEATEVLQKIAERDLSARVKGDYKGEYAKIKEAINTATNNLDRALLQVSIAAEQVASASNQISSGSQSLAQGASEQAGSLEEVSSSLQEMSSMTKQNAANAKEARSLSEGARISTERGVDSMKRLTTAIDKIKASADETAKIVKTIDEIAFQTNLLALNAAVEAARAGDAGKGFAVVAEEVRNLAMRSAEAAKNTANLIEGSVKNAEGGVAINQEVIKNLEEINEQVKKVSEVMAEIAAASDQQSQGIDQINTAVEQMNQVTQQAAANSEESASAAEELSGQSEELLNLVSAFRLTGANGSGANFTAHSQKRATGYTTHPPATGQKRREPVLAGNRTVTDSRASGPMLGINPSKLIPFDNDSDNGVLRDF